MKIFLGPAGIPISAKGKSSIEGVKTVSELGLNTMEIEFVRGVVMSNKTAKELGTAAKDLGIKLSVHAPYYINLNSDDKDKLTASKKRVLDSLERAHHMGAEAIAVHASYYGNDTPEKTYDDTKEACIDILETAKKDGFNDVSLGLETMGKKAQFGSLEELIKLSKEIKIIPYIDWAHIFVRQNGVIDYAEVFDEIEKIKPKKIHSHFENVKKNNAGEFVDVHIPIDHSPAFEPLAKEILKRKIDITLISESPLLERDAIKMKNVLENIGYKF
ncbi:MAG: TIM barrel protein [Candidatus Aenigmarchaeota archaeon]|nr:TIM barrel protein [Candidatus Aenigmarchaeota archaeon]